ncbi:MAG: hypothetical protein AAFP76_06240 [Bacteroidota bacterium]
MKRTKNNWIPRTRGVALVCLLLCALLTQAQEKRLEGKISNTKDVEGIHILNTSSRFNSVTNAQGAFFITVRPLDTLLISSVTYIPEQVVISKEIYEKGFLTLTLKDLVNELDEVYLGPKLSGNLEQDIKSIEVEDQINFDDLGIPGFKGKPEEKISPVVPVIPLAVDLEGLYKHLSGYYRKLKLKRKWEAQNVTVAHIINRYTAAFFEESYEIPPERLYDFLLFCVETSSLQKDYETEKFNLVLETFASKGKEYNLRWKEKEE